MSGVWTLNSEPGFNPASADDAPFGGGFKNGEQTGHNQNQPPQCVVADNDAGDEAKRADDSARQPPVAVQIWTKEFAHDKKLAYRALKAKSGVMVRQRVDG